MTNDAPTEGADDEGAISETDPEEETTSDKGGDSDPSTNEGFEAPDSSRTGEAQAAENRDRESPS